MRKTVLTYLFAGLQFAAAADVTGHYYLRGEMEVGSELQLNPNGTFEYMLAYGAADYFAKGTWKVDKDAVVLTTSGRDEPPITLASSSAGQRGSVHVTVKAQNGHPIEHVEVALKTAEGMLKQSTQRDGTAVFEGVQHPVAIVLRVRVYGVEAGPFNVESGRNDLSFELNGEAITRVPFKQERLRINGDVLEMRFWNKDHAMRYVKD